MKWYKTLLQSLYFKRKCCASISNNRENCKVLAEYFKELFNCETPLVKLELREVGLQNLDSILYTKQELLEIIKSFINNKAMEKFQKIWEEKILEEWKIVLIQTLHKRTTRQMSTTRHSSLLRVTYKILSKYFWID